MMPNQELVPDRTYRDAVGDDPSRSLRLSKLAVVFRCASKRAASGYRRCWRIQRSSRPGSLDRGRDGGRPRATEAAASSPSMVAAAAVAGACESELRPSPPPSSCRRGSVGEPVKVVRRSFGGRDSRPPCRCPASALLPGTLAADLYVIPNHACAVVCRRAGDRRAIPLWAPEDGHYHRPAVRSDQPPASRQPRTGDSSSRCSCCRAAWTAA